MRTPRTLSYEQAKRLYDCVEAKQDTKGFYERAALADLVAHLDISRAQRLLEPGCGIGRFAEEFLDRYLSSTACYVGLDVSRTMAKLAQSRTARFAGRAAIQQTSGTPQVDDGSFDRFISNNVAIIVTKLVKSASI